MEQVTVVSGNGSNPNDKVVDHENEVRVIANPVTGEEVELTASVLVNAWTETKNYIRQLYRFKDLVERNLVELTGPPLDGGRTAYLNTENGKLKIQKKDTTTWDQRVLKEAVFILGPIESESLGIRTEYKPHLGKLRSFLNTEQGDDSLKKAKELIIEAKTVRELKPIITLVADNKENTT